MSAKESQEIAKQIQKLRSTGLVVNVFHRRYFPNVAYLGSDAKDCHYMTHKQYNRLLAEKKIYSVSPVGSYKFEHVVSAYGGYTEIEITNNGTIITFGRLKQSIVKRDGNCLPFTKRIGYQGAWGRCVKRLLGKTGLVARRDARKAEKNKTSE